MRKNGMIALSFVLAVSIASCGAQGPALTYRSSLGLEFVLVKAGTFQMGSEGAALDAAPPHSVTLGKDYRCYRGDL